MSVFEKNRFKIFSGAQHPYQHPVSDFGYSNSRLPGVTNVSDAMDYLIASMYPNWKATVPNVAQLPIVGLINDFYIVEDDGDGKAAGYIWSKVDNVEKWIKRYDVDWSYEGILAESLDSTRHVYAHKYGFTDLDDTGTPFAGDLAGQRLYGGTTLNSNLTFYANSGDTVGNTGYVQFGDNVRPLTDSNFSLGTTGYRWSNVWTDALTVDTMSFSSGSINDTTGDLSFNALDLTTTGNIDANTIGIDTSATISTFTITSGSIVDSSGSISFGNENLSSSGTLASGTHTISSSLVLATGSITSGTNAISFDNENLSTSGTLWCGALTATSVSVDDILLNSNTISTQTLDANLNISANGTGFINLQSATHSLDQVITGIVGITGQLNADNLRLDGNAITSTNANGNISVSPAGSGEILVGSTISPIVDNVSNLGKSGGRFLDLWLGGSIKDDTNIFNLSELMSLRDVVYRDAARTLPALGGDTLFYDAINNLWLANHPDTEITHSELTGLTTLDAGHTQFALLAGRASGQSVIGGTAASEDLTLESTAHATKGFIKFKDTILPYTNASYSGGWSGEDIGDGTHYIRHIYSKGEHKGLRIENFTSLTLPASASSNVGRAAYATDNNRLYIDSGSAWNVVTSVNKFVQDVSFDGVQTIANVDVSSKITDARNASFELLDNVNNFQKMFVQLEATSASNIKITTNIALSAGSYRLIVLE